MIKVNFKRIGGEGTAGIIGLEDHIHMDPFDKPVYNKFIFGFVLA